MADALELPSSLQYKATMEKLEKIKRVTAGGADYWLAREMCPVLGYTWEGFEAVITRAMSACEGVGVMAENHFRRTSAMVKLGSGAQRKVPDHFLSRTACYLVAMNGDPAKPEIAAAQAYFTVQTRRMEMRDEVDAQLAYDERRLVMSGALSCGAGSPSRSSGSARSRNRPACGTAASPFSTMRGIAACIEARARR